MRPEAAFWGKIWFFGPLGAAPRLRHATQRLVRGNSARRTSPAYATGVGRALSPRATPPGVVTAGIPRRGGREVSSNLPYLEGARLFVPI
eukprot:1623205-Prymnesium_polylepis.1